jgi:hypothetical protein
MRDNPCEGTPVSEAADMVRTGRGVMWQMFGQVCFLPYSLSQLRKIEVPVRVWLTNTYGRVKNELIPSELYAQWRNGELTVGVYRRCDYVPLAVADLRGYDDDETNMDTATV